MKLKRIISLLLVLVTLTLTVASCKIGGEATTTQPTQSTVDTTTPDPDQDEWDKLYDIITVAKALEIAEGATTATDEIYYVRGTVVTITNPDYGAMVISDGADEISVYNTKAQDGTYFPNLADAPVKGDEVLLLCSLQNYNGTLEIKQAYLVDFKKADKGNIDVSSYTEMTIAKAREAEVDTMVKISGVVARITYANGMKPSGVYLVDNTGSIYVYDNDIAGQVEIGNTITVLGSKTFWILESESSNAQKYGYKGCCQIADATLYENDDKISTVDYKWCQELSVKDILDIPVTENVTTNIFKTTALVKKVPGNGFTNYYFFDLDGKTGAYTYTQCNGDDFTWLDEFDGKICTVYLSPMNAKSTSSDCYFRFLPIAVIDEGFTFDVSKAPEHAVEYYAVDQFLSRYTGDPMLEVVTSVSSDLLGFENVTLSYTSSNEEVLYFAEEDGKLVFHCGANGTATVTVTATYGDYTHTETVEITVIDPSKIESITVSEAIATAVDETVTVKGIVGPSLVNQSGFYLIDESGVIAVRVDSSAFEGLAIGQEVFVEGTRSVTKDGAGQICIDSATILVNLYGNQDYSTASFITDKTFAEVTGTSDSPEATTQVYVVTATVKVVTTDYYSNIYLTNGSTNFNLYCSGSNQYSWLKEYDGQEVTVEFALCDWNAKGLKGAVLAVITDDGKIYNEFNFNK